MMRRVRQICLTALVAVLLVSASAWGAWTAQYYVTPAGAGAHDGSSEANAFSLDEAIADCNAAGAGGRANSIYWVKQSTGYTRSASDTITGGGSAAGGPCVWEGYNATPGDGYLGRTGGSMAGALITTNMPTLAYGAYQPIVNGTYNALKNLAITLDRTYGIQFKANYNHATNCSFTNVSASTLQLAYDGSYCRFENCDFACPNAGNALLLSSHTKAENCRITAPYGVGVTHVGFDGTAAINCLIFDCTTGVSDGNTYSQSYNSRCTIIGCGVAYRAHNSGKARFASFVDCTFLGCTTVFSNPYYGTAQNPLSVQNCVVAGYTWLDTGATPGFSGWSTFWDYTDLGAAYDPANAVVNWAGGDYTPTGAFARAYPGVGAIIYQPTLPTEAQVEDGVFYGVNNEYEGELVAGGGATPVYGGKTGGK